MTSQGVGVLIDLDRLKEGKDGYYVESSGDRYYGSSPEDAYSVAKTALSAGKLSVTEPLAATDVKEQQQSAVGLGTKPLGGIQPIIPPGKPGALTPAKQLDLTPAAAAAAMPGDVPANVASARVLLGVTANSTVAEINQAAVNAIKKIQANGRNMASSKPKIDAAKALLIPLVPAGKVPAPGRTSPIPPPSARSAAAAKAAIPGAKTAIPAAKSAIPGSKTPQSPAAPKPANLIAARKTLKAVPPKASQASAKPTPANLLAARKTLKAVPSKTSAPPPPAAKTPAAKTPAAKTPQRPAGGPPPVPRSATPPRAPPPPGAKTPSAKAPQRPAGGPPPVARPATPPRAPPPPAAKAPAPAAKTPQRPAGGPPPVARPATPPRPPPPPSAKAPAPAAKTPQRPAGGPPPVARSATPPRPPPPPSAKGPAPAAKTPQRPAGGPPPLLPVPRPLLAPPRLLAPRLSQPRPLLDYLQSRPRQVYRLPAQCSVYQQAQQRRKYPGRRLMRNARR